MTKDSGARLALIGLALVSGLGACKPASKATNNGAQTKNLEDLATKAGDKKTDYRCGTEYSGGSLPDYIEPLRALIEPAASELKNVVLGTATALPAPIAQLIAGTKTRIRIVANAVAECADTPFKAAEHEVTGAGTPVTSCWRQKPRERPEIILQADKALIQKSFVRLGSYLFAEFLIPRVNDATAPAPFNGREWQAAAAKYKTARARVAAALLEDLKGYDAGIYEKFSRMNAVDAVAFGNIAVAEAADSYYCGTRSRQAFEARFKKTWAVFAKTDDAGSIASMFGVRWGDAPRAP